MHISLAAEELFRIGSFPVSNSLLTTWIVMAILIVIAFLVSRSYKSIPGRIQSIFELIVEKLLDLTEGITNDRALARRFFPLVATILIFVTTANWFGLFPGIGTITIPGHEEAHTEETTDTHTDAYEEEAAHTENKEHAEESHDEEHATEIPVLRPSNTDLNTTLAIAVIAVLAVQFFGITTIGFFKYTKKFINFSSPINFFIGLLELISEVAKVISFAFRLFGNIFAGEVLLVVIAALIPFLAPLPFYFLEVFVGFIQGLVFAMLTLVFLTVAAQHSDH